MIYAGMIVGAIVALALHIVCKCSYEEGFNKGLTEKDYVDEYNAKCYADEAYEKGYQAGYEEGRYAREVMSNDEKICSDM